MLSAQRGKAVFNCGGKIKDGIDGRYPGPPLLNVEKVALVDGLEGRLHEAADWVEPRRQSLCAPVKPTRVRSPHASWRARPYGG